MPTHSEGTPGPLDLFSVAGRVAIVTGASSGIGARFSETLARAGAHVMMAARRLERLEALAEQLPQAVPFQCDVTSEDACGQLVDETLKRYGRVDILVNNAGTAIPVPAEDETLEQFNRVLHLNLSAAFSLSQLVGRGMLSEGQGSIINIASIFGLVGIGRMPQASYAASKAGLVNLTRELAAQWARRGVRVNAIAPGFFPTEVTADLFDREEGKAWVARLTPMGRGGRLEELDGALLYLASDASTYVTGAVLPVDGGWTAV